MIRFSERASFRPFLVPACVIALFAWACHGNPQPGAGTTDSVGHAKADTTDRTNYFPVADYLRSEIAYVDSQPLPIRRYDMHDDRTTDSGFITTKDFHRIAESLIPRELDSAWFCRHFEESSFLDRSNNQATFTYSTRDTGNGLKRVDVVTSPDAGFSRVASLYLESLSGSGDSAVTQKLYWKAHTQFNLIRVHEPPNRPSYSTQLMVKWDAAN